MVIGTSALEQTVKGKQFQNSLSEVSNREFQSVKSGYNTAVQHCIFELLLLLWASSCSINWVCVSPHWFLLRELSFCDNLIRFPILNNFLANTQSHCSQKAWKMTTNTYFISTAALLLPLEYGRGKFSSSSLLRFSCQVVKLFVYRVLI